jgi:hypothetical protein
MLPGRGGVSRHSGRSGAGKGDRLTLGEITQTLFPDYAKIRRFLQQPKQRRTLFIEAYWRLAWARLLLRFLPFRRLTRFFNHPLPKTVLSMAQRQQLRCDVSWAIDRASVYLPGQTVCFPRGIAAQLMCRKRGIDTIMYYGAAIDPVLGLRAHVWVLDGSDGVVGHNIAGQYGVLARYPA